MLKRRMLMAAAFVSAPLLARAQSAWPSKTIRFICPFAPGGGTDTSSRLIADQLSRVLGQTVVVDNNGGAGGNIGTTELARAVPDGYTIGLISVPAIRSIRCSTPRCPTTPTRTSWPSRAWRCSPTCWA